MVSMSKLYEVIDDDLRRFIAAQHVFFVATAPSGSEGHINCSPKGLDTFRVLDPQTVAYVDFVGSGVETISHLRQNGRIVFLFCAFDGPPKILRLHGRGEAIELGHPEFGPLFATFGRESTLGVRSVVRVAVTRIADSCGYAVPLYRFEGERDQLDAWAQRKGEDGVATYKQENNASSIDGLAGLLWPGRR
jgi:hypothetical protein